MSETVDAFLDRYIRWYSGGDVDGATDVCIVPFVAVRDGVEIHLPDRNVLRDHLVVAHEACLRLIARAASPAKLEAGRIAQAGALTRSAT